MVGESVAIREKDTELELSTRTNASRSVGTRKTLSESEGRGKVISQGTNHTK